jgi:N4-gp56 family major capsid protein
MANAYTDIQSGASLGVNLVQTVYDKYVEFALRDTPMIREIADKHPVDPTSAGGSVVLQIFADLAPATTPLNEIIDPDSVALPSTSTVTIAVNEYGNSAITTRKLQLFSLADVDPAIADIMARNQVDSVDVVAQTELRQGTNVFYSGDATSTVTVDATDEFDSHDVMLAVTKLRTNKSVPWKGNLYWCGIHPNISADLREETGAAAWRDPHNYSAAGNIWAGELGDYHGAFFVENPRMYHATDGAASARVYRTLFSGRQSLAEAVALEPATVVGPVVDSLRRLQPIGWYGALGWKRFREEALVRVESGSSFTV